MLDAEMAQKLRDANPEAFRNIVARAFKAHGRGFWNADSEPFYSLEKQIVLKTFINNFDLVYGSMMSQIVPIELETKNNRYFFRI